MLGNGRGHRVYKYLVFIKKCFSKCCSTTHSLTSGIVLKSSSLLQPVLSLEYIDVVRYSKNSAKWKDFQEGVPIYKRGDKVRRINHKGFMLR